MFHLPRNSVNGNFLQTKTNQKYLSYIFSGKFVGELLQNFHQQQVSSIHALIHANNGSFLKLIGFLK